jgi:hypothetical protein
MWSNAPTSSFSRTDRLVVSARSNRTVWLASVERSASSADSTSGRSATTVTADPLAT